MSEQDIQKAGGYGLKYVLTNHFFTLLGANLLCFLFCIPIVTIPASLCALHASVQQYYRKGYGDLWPTFIREFKADFLPRLGISLGLLAVPGLGWWIGSLFGTTGAYLGLALTAMFTLLTFAWLFPQLALLKAPPLMALKNALLLTAIESKKNLLLLVITLACFAPMLLLIPYSVFLFFCLYPLVPILLRTAVTDRVLQQRLVVENETNAESNESNE